MAYAPDESATFVGLERLRATLDGKEGTFVLQHVGTFRDGTATADLSVAPGSGTGDLVGVTGSGRFTANPGGSVELELDFARPDADWSSKASRSLAPDVRRASDPGQGDGDAAAAAR